MELDVRDLQIVVKEFRRLDSKILVTFNCSLYSETQDFSYVVTVENETRSNVEYCRQALQNVRKQIREWMCKCKETPSVIGTFMAVDPTTFLMDEGDEGFIDEQKEVTSVIGQKRTREGTTTTDVNMTEF
jgi:hypothetical protein